ncbi:3-oxoacyl-[acyl-carrier-protein] synthase III C-terminal domain-containing protein [Streptomyces sp. NBC_00094]|uniref:3-oxoacyl-[acyl-carrier-protein] synthase III C-terminal domain-containing protein n=1 Tax=Streptomyces sp. NBC_00094 TaxID=2903620 RepID=UPI0022586B7F|nr:3-oxoacyl-[acyl-carrier-protein] synthase III C-terminal domain-containing protein [Streptomyces sp. NBC_00094]MCX5391926.1 3-oxoacyl-ACP synthase [Streptomyces sp. NBC_00094]
MSATPPAVGLSRVAVRLPRHTEPVDEVLARTGHSITERRMFSRFYGLRDSTVLGPGESLEDLLAEAGAAALDGVPPSLILYGHTLLVQEFGTRPGFATRMRARLGAPDAAFHGVSQVGCTSVLRSVELARRYLGRPGSLPTDRVLVLGGDQGSILDGARVLPRTTVASDTAVAAVVTPEPPGGGGRPIRYRHLSTANARDTRFHRNLRMSEAEFAAYGKVCGDLVQRVLGEAADRAGLALADVDLVMPHMSNAVFWKAVCRATGIPRERVCLELLPERGHGFGTDALMALEHADSTGRLRPGDRCALVSIGQGAYFTAIVVEVLEES